MLARILLYVYPGFFCYHSASDSPSYANIWDAYDRGPKLSRFFERLETASLGICLRDMFNNIFKNGVKNLADSTFLDNFAL